MRVGIPPRAFPISTAPLTTLSHLLCDQDATARPDVRSTITRRVTQHVCRGSWGGAPRHIPAMHGCSPQSLARGSRSTHHRTRDPAARSQPIILPTAPLRTRIAPHAVAPTIHCGLQKTRTHLHRRPSQQNLTDHTDNARTHPTRASRRRSRRGARSHGARLMSPHIGHAWAVAHAFSDDY